MSVRRWTGVVAGLVVVGVALVGCSSSGGSAGPDQSPAVAPWAVGSCVYQIGGPTAIPSSVDPGTRRAMIAQQQYQAVACTDPHAKVRITALGATPDVLGNVKGDSGCPGDTDQIFQTSGLSGNPLACGRNLVGPHPGDPGQGGGPEMIVGDCVGVSTTGDQFGTNVFELPCDWKDGYWGQVVDRAASTQQCPPATTISRFPLTGGGVLCVGQGGAGQMAAAGNCVIRRTDLARPLSRTPCGPDTDKLVAFADTRAACPSGTGALNTFGYDRVLCLRAD